MDSRTGARITACQAENRVFIWEINNPLTFKIREHSQRPFRMNNVSISIQIIFNHNITKALGIHICFHNFRISTTLQRQTGPFIRVYRYQVLKYFYSLGVNSINNVIRAVVHVLYDILENRINVTATHDIKYKFY
uniref:Replication enhancer n=1 Tax=Tomato yellow leaf curl virus TaxID=10832 RepID=A0A0A1EIX3_9GEMI|nr:AC3 protein [Tomato yellow leaf curl virus]